jgi:hypothetical protein
MTNDPATRERMKLEALMREPLALFGFSDWDFIRY